MSFRIFCVCVLLSAFSSSVWPQSPQSSQPRLVLLVVVDQMRYDYLTRFGAEYSGGLRRLLDEGAVFTNAHYEAAPTVTAVGHATILSGATPSVSGIAGNLFYGRAEGRPVQSITDPGVRALGRNGTGASPKRLAVTTVGDELKLSGRGGKVFGTSLKDRSAILPAGRGADGAYWFGDEGTIVSSSWYFPELPHGFWTITPPGLLNALLAHSGPGYSCLRLMTKTSMNSSTGPPMPTRWFWSLPCG